MGNMESGRGYGQGEAGSIYGLWLSEQLTPKYHVARACGRVRALLS